MRQLLAVLILGMACLAQTVPSPGPGVFASGGSTPTVALVQSNYGYNSTACSPSCSLGNVTFVSNNTAGKVIVACLESNSASPSTFSVTDTRNTYTDGAAGVVANGGASVYCAYSLNIAGGANTVAFNLTSGSTSYDALYIAEFTLTGTQSADGSGSNTGNSAAPSTGSFSVTTGDLVVGMMASQGSAAAGAGWTAIAGTDTYSMMEWQQAASSTATAAWTAASGTWAALGVGYK